MRTDEAIGAELARQGVHQVFGLMGEDVAKLLAHLSRHGVSYLSSRHESSAIGMADGYSRISGGVGVAVLSRGPGFTNAVTALTTASRAGSRVVAVVADTAVGLEHPSVAEAGRRAPKHVDQAGVLEAVGVRHVTLRSPDTAISELRAVFDRARSGMTVVVNLPTDVIGAEAGSAPGSIDIAEAPEPALPSPDEIDQVADLLETTWAASRPVILAGRGAVRSDAQRELRLLGERTGGLLVTTLLAKSFYRGDPYDAGIMGTFSTPVASDLLGRADVLLAFGAGLNRLTTFGGDLCPKARIVQFDANPEAFGRFTEPELTVLGDVRLSAAALLAELDRRGHQHEGYRTRAVAEDLAKFDLRGSFRDQTGPSGLDPRTLLLALDDLLPPDRLLVADSGHHMAFQVSYLDVADPASAVLPLDFSAIGTAPGIAIGAAVAQQDRLTVLGVGDGGLMMALGELDTAVRAGVPLLVVVLNDAAYGAEVQFLDVDGLAPDVAFFEHRSFEAVAAAIGMKALTVSSLDDLRDLKTELDSLGGPLLVDCRITTDVRADFINSWSVLTKARASDG